MARSAGTFQKGKIGNLKGRPKASHTAATFQEIISKYNKKHDCDAFEIITERLIMDADAGDKAAVKILMDRHTPVMKPFSRLVTLPPLTGTLTERAEQIAGYVTSGELTSDEAPAILSRLGSIARIKEVEELSEKMDRLEKALTNAQNQTKPLNQTGR